MKVNPGRAGAWGHGIALLACLTAAPVALGAAGDAAKGAQIYEAQKCMVCHRVGEKGGKLGPDLSDVGAKRDAAWLARYLVDPKAEIPEAKMPAVKVKGQDLDDLVAHLLTLKIAP